MIPDTDCIKTFFKEMDTMGKKLYAKPAVMSHETISFETGLSSCIKIATVEHSNPPEKVCLRSDYTWGPLPK